jgi:hypothetical protein
MPVYQCYSSKGLLTNSAKAKIAEEITSIYCNATGGSELFVHVATGPSAALEPHGLGCCRSHVTS